LSERVCDKMLGIVGWSAKWKFAKHGRMSVAHHWSLWITHNCCRHQIAGLSNPAQFNFKLWWLCWDMGQPSVLVSTFIHGWPMVWAIAVNNEHKRAILSAQLRDTPGGRWLMSEYVIKQLSAIQVSRWRGSDCE
jgi:hypothetical protein